jgi:hypothetical protein
MRKSSETYEVHAKSLTPRGTPYHYFGKEFSPDGWVDVTDEEREQLKGKPHLTIRKKGDGQDNG